MFTGLENCTQNTHFMNKTIDLWGGSIDSDK